MALSSRGSLTLATALFFLSGALGLGYQLVWIRKAALIVGASQIALATVLTSFFLGLGVGSLVVGRHLKSRRWSPLFVYGLFEAAIGVFALAFPVLFVWVEGAYGGLYPLFEGNAVGLFGARFGLIFALFVLPTFFMGGTLPLLLDGLVERDQAVGSLTSFLYGVNILGAVAGVLATAYFAIPALGMDGTSRAAGVGNLSIAAVALLAFRGARAPTQAPRDHATERRLPVFYGALGFASGLAAIGYQVLWARYFSLFSVSSVYLTAILLAVYLAALATGSMLLAPLLQRFQDRLHPLRVVAVVQPLVAVLVFLTLEWWRVAEYRTEFLGGLAVAHSWQLFGQVPDAIFFAPLFQVALVIFVPVTLIGTVLPALIVAASPRRDTLRATAGSLAFWNTLGASAGGFAAGYLLIPGVGLTGSFLCLAVVSVAVGAAAQWRLHRRRADAATAVAAATTARAATAGFAFCALALIGTLLLAREDVTRRTILEDGVASRTRGLELVDVVEGPLATAFVLDGPRRIIATGNQTLAAVMPGTASTQAIQGHIPALFYPRAGSPERALGIALGSGQSFGALLRYPLAQLDVVDISSEMVELSLRHFADVNNGLGSDPRVAFHLDDGRHFVDRASDASYDVVSMEPPPPAADGVHTLYSVEFYRGVKRVLREGGVFMQWLPLYLITPGELRGIIATQAAVFPHSFVVMVGHSDFMVLSFRQEQPPLFRGEWIAERARTFSTEKHVAGSIWTSKNRHAIDSPLGVLSLILTGPEDIARMDGSLVYHDDDLRLSYSSGDQGLRRFRGFPVPASRVSFAALPLTPFADLQQYFAEPIPTAMLDAERARSLGAFNVPAPAELARSVARFEAATVRGDRAELAMRIALAYGSALAVPEALGWVGRAIAALPDDAREAQLDAARALALELRPVYADELRGWLDALPPEQRGASIARVMGEALGDG